MKPNGYEFWFEADGGKTKVQLPVNPDKITVKRSAKNETVNIVEFGEITVMGGHTPIQISFSSIFPNRYFTGCAVKKPLWASAYTSMFRIWTNAKNPLRFTVTKCGIVGYVTIESFQYSESGGDVGTYEYSMTLKEYSSVRVRQIDLNKTTKKVNISKKTAARISTKAVPKTYTVKQGDCLWNLAKKFYGDGSKYTKIYDANKKIIGANRNLIYAGQVLTIP